MNKDDIVRMAHDAGMTPISHVSTADVICSRASLERFAHLVAAAEREHIAREFKNTLKVAEERGATVEREACAGIDVNVVVPERDYKGMSPKEIYEEALIDAGLAFRAAIRERGQ